MTENIESIENHDSATLARVFNNMSGRGSIGNPTTGLGTSRDPSTHAEVLQPYQLSHLDCENLIEGSRIARNIVSVYPMESSWANFTFGNENYRKYSSYSQKAADYFQNLKTGSLHMKFIEVSIEARLHGEAFLLMGFEDGQSYDKPLNEDNLII